MQVKDYKCPKSHILFSACLATLECLTQLNTLERVFFLHLCDTGNSLFGTYFSGSCEGFAFSTCLLNARVSQSPVFRILSFCTFWGPNTDGHHSIYYSYHDGSQICLWPRLLTQLNMQWLSAEVCERGPTETGGLTSSSCGYTYSGVNIFCR